MAGNEKTLLEAKLKNGIRLSEQRPFFLGFLDESGVAFCQDLLQAGTSSLFWGGYPEAERKLLGLFPDYMEPDPSAFPLTPLTLFFRKEYSLSHRDFLGSFMALGVERDVVGDILVEEGRCVAFLREEMISYFCANLRKVGRVGVKLVPGAEEPLPVSKTFLELSGVVASQRLDAVVAFLCKLSRDKAARLIDSGLVLLNHREILSGSAHVSEGNVLSVRGHGKFVIDGFGPLTSKGRIVVKCKKYL